MSLFPGSLDSDSSLYVAKDYVATTLSSAQAIGDNVAVVADGSKWAANMVLSVDVGKTNVEQELVTSVNGNVLTVTRGFGGTVAAAHASGAIVGNNIDAIYQSALKSAIVAIETALGANLSNVPVSPLVSSDIYNFAPRTPGGNLGVGANTITLNPMPPGIVAGSVGIAYLYISGGVGAAEAVPVIGVTATTVTVTCANTRSGAWTIQSASAGIVEADQAIGAANPGSIYVPAGNKNVYATVQVSHSLVGAGPGAANIVRQFAGTTDTILQLGTGDTFIGNFSVLDGAGTPTGGFAVHQKGFGQGLSANIVVDSGYGALLFENIVRGACRGCIAIGVTIGIRQINSGMVFSDLLQSLSAANAINFDGQSGLCHLANFDFQNTGTSGLGINLSPTGTDAMAECTIANGTLDSHLSAAININPASTAKVFDVLFENIYITRVSGSVGVAINQYAYSLSFEHVKVLSAGGALGDCMALSGKNMRLHGIELLYNGAAGVGSRGIVLTSSPHTISIQGSTLGYDYNTGLPSTNFAAGITTDANPITDLIVIGNRLAGSSGGMVMGAGASANWTIVGNTFPTAAITLGGNETNLLVHSNLGIGFTVPSKSPVIANYIASETGANNAIAGALSGVALASGLTVTVKLAHTLQAGANTFNLNGGGNVAIKSCRNVANNIATAYAATGTVTLQYDGAEWVDLSQ